MTRKKRIDQDDAIKKAVAKAKKIKIESIYYLYVDEEKDWPIYIGRTKQTLKARLGKHISESKTGNSKKCNALRTLISEGFKIQIGLIDEWPTNEAGRAEDLAISNAIGAGLKLLNTIENVGTDDYIVEIDGDVKKSVWVVSDFSDGWVKGHGKCIANEWHKEINGVSFFRAGRSRLRFDHPVYRQWDCLGITWEVCVQNAINFFTPGTEQRERMIAGIKNNQ